MHLITDLLAGNARTPDEIRDAVYLSGADARAKHGRFWLLLVLATGIATAGILGDSTATVIGAMIVAPLGTPIQGVAVAIAFGDLRALLRSSLTLLGGALLTVAFAALLALVLPQLEPLAENSQIVARVSPTLIDLVAAAFTGLAGSLAISRRDIGDILPGVAIAISLVPPLAVVGVTLGEGDLTDALGALLLFVTNVVAMIVLGAGVFTAVRLHHNTTATATMRPAYAVVGVAAVVVCALLAAATYRTVSLYDTQQRADRVGVSWAEDNREQLVAVRFEGDDLVFVVQGQGSGGQDRELLRLLHGRVTGGTPVVVDRISGAVDQIGAVPAD